MRDPASFRAPRHAVRHDLIGRLGSINLPAWLLETGWPSELVPHIPRYSAGWSVLRQNLGFPVPVKKIQGEPKLQGCRAVAPDPEDGDRRLLLAVKQNLSASASGLAFCIETEDNVPRLAWEPGAVALAANDVLGNVEGISRACPRIPTHSHALLRGCTAGALC